MFSRLFPVVFLCLVIGVATAGAQTNALLNPSFEDPGSVGANPTSWVKFNSDGLESTGFWHLTAHDGTFFMRKVYNGGPGSTAVAQAFPSVSGLTYDATAYVAGDWLNNPPDAPAVARGRVGLDPTGQTANRGAGTIVWSAWVPCTNRGEWYPATVTGVLATGSTMSIYIEGEVTSNPGPESWAGNFFDSAFVPGQALPTPTPTPILNIQNLQLDFEAYNGNFNNVVAKTWSAWWIEAASSEAAGGVAMVKPEAFWDQPAGLSGSAQWIWDFSDSENFNAGLNTVALIDLGSLFRMNCFFYKTTGEGDEVITPASDRLVNLGYAFGHTLQPKTDRSPAAFPAVEWVSELEGGPEHNPGLDFNATGVSEPLDQWFSIYSPLIEATSTDISLFIEVLRASPGSSVDFYIDEMGFSLTSTSVEEEHWSLFR